MGFLVCFCEKLDYTNINPMLALSLFHVVSLSVYFYLEVPVYLYFVSIL